MSDAGQRHVLEEQEENVLHLQARNWCPTLHMAEPEPDDEPVERQLPTRPSIRSFGHLNDDERMTGLDAIERIKKRMGWE